ncbi:hypothetical protein IscW_ISCW005669 [Ixodes scapularis]|uniref:Uncharacterized protein n=1 Tax=Ixodes scapularis TaxID=6945 RepID=B7PLR2_IXOSC|nr:hypothetical protein IscW_ISCW005669 [Ixodes scapularis]|eukprot:XP_002434710.1 hypothetical protein IscW_ISCW005669 [Ixodes scapularis]
MVNSSCRTRSVVVSGGGASSEDGAYSSTSEAEPDSDHEELDLDSDVDPQKLLGAWLGELDAISLGARSVAAAFEDERQAPGTRAAAALFAYRRGRTRRRPAGEQVVPLEGTSPREHTPCIGA